VEVRSAVLGFVLGGWFGIIGQFPENHPCAFAKGKRHLSRSLCESGGQQASDSLARPTPIWVLIVGATPYPDFAGLLDHPLGQSEYRGPVKRTPFLRCVVQPFDQGTDVRRVDTDEELSLSRKALRMGLHDRREFASQALP